MSDIKAYFTQYIPILMLKQRLECESTNCIYQTKLYGQNQKSQRVIICNIKFAVNIAMYNDKSLAVQH